MAASVLRDPEREQAALWSCNASYFPTHGETLCRLLWLPPGGSLQLSGLSPPGLGQHCAVSSCVAAPPVWGLLRFPNVDCCLTDAASFLLFQGL